MLSVAKHDDSKLNQLQRDLPEGLVVDSVWLTERGYSTSLRTHYVSAGWLERVARRVYRRPRGTLTWQQVVISLQAVMQLPLVVGGRTALDLQGLSHYLSDGVREVHLYGPDKAPTWLNELRLGVRFCSHNSRRLFRNDPIVRDVSSVDWNIDTDQGKSADPIHGSFRYLPVGHWEWPLTVSTPERAILELMDELPNRESFHQVDKLMEGLPNLSPRRLQKLLVDCRSVKVKRLFFFYAHRHRHRWLGQIDMKTIDLGAGNRSLVKGGKFNAQFKITLPEDLDGVQ